MVFIRNRKLSQTRLRPPDYGTADYRMYADALSTM